MCTVYICISGPERAKVAKGKVTKVNEGRVDPGSSKCKDKYLPNVKKCRNILKRFHIGEKEKGDVKYLVTVDSAAGAK